MRRNRWMRLWPWCVWIFLLGLACGAAAQDQHRNSPPQPGLEGDPRLQQSTRFSTAKPEGGEEAVPWRGTVEALFFQLNPQLIPLPMPKAQEPLVAQHTLRPEMLTVATPVKGSQSALGTMLAGMAVSMNATWVPVAQQWVLTDLPVLAPMLVLDFIKFMDQFGPALGVQVDVGELTPAQLAIVRGGGRLTPENLSLHQRHTAMVEVLYAYFLPEGRRSVSPDAFRLEGVYISFPPIGPETSDFPPELGLYVPRADGRPPDSHIHVP